ncbi:hypothetical protein, partial [Streptomyces sp. NPDC001652]|uniref:hypothetical protein n=1 Tax=Streptomyces sp. NPDC001652 TaxID=3154393 RepID=UPI003323BC7A
MFLSSATHVTRENSDAVPNDPRPPRKPRTQKTSATTRWDSRGLLESNRKTEQPWGGGGFYGQHGGFFFIFLFIKTGKTKRGVWFFFLLG